MTSLLRFRAYLTRRAVLLLLGAGLLFGPGDRSRGQTPADDAKVEKPTQFDPHAARALERFTKSIYPLLTRGGEKSCVGCHRSEEKSNLVLIGNPVDDFRLLLQNQYFDPQRPDSILARITSANPDVRMPRDGAVWSTREIQLLRTFLRQLDENVQLDPNADEQFPESLVTQYTGEEEAKEDNQFITFTQLKGKIRTIFQDDWVREGRDLFSENVELFGGADFKKRFSEARDPSTTFLTAMNVLAADVCQRAYTRRTGPFAGHNELTSPVGQSAADDDYRREITRLYRSILFRSPTELEVKQAFAMIQGIFSAGDTIGTADYQLAFRVTALDPETKLTSSRTIRIPVSGEKYGVYQELLDQSAGTPSADNDRIVRHTLARRLALAKGQSGQRVVIHNDQSVGNVSLVGVQWKLAGGEQVQSVRAGQSGLEAEGAWTIEDKNGFTSFEDGNVEKGNSHITVPIAIGADGEYELSILWRKNERNAKEVLVEVYGEAIGDTLARPRLAEVPARGEARLFYDCSTDTIPFANLGIPFQFGDEDFVEINNAGTDDRVTAAAMEFISLGNDAQRFTIDSMEADGSDKWSKFDAGRFKAYNVKGTQLHDDNANKGERFLRYRPYAKREASDGWSPDKWYDIHVYYPGKRENESHTPVIIKAQRSSPIIQLVHPARARADAAICLDASASYSVQHSPLEFTWEQIEGPPVKLSGEGPVVTFTAQRRSLHQAAWEALAQALLRHPDFLFTRPPSLHQITDPREQQQLRLVKIALDLVGRVPTPSELKRLTDGASLGDLVESYLASQEFRDFYLHRIRLYLESQGTESQDEPVRLWCHIAFNDLPFQQILTADYTVDAAWQKQSRPEFHGRTGLLTTKGFIEGKPGLPHYNYAAQVSMMFLGYVFEVPSEIIDQREGITAAGTTDPTSVCYSCHKTLTPLAFQRQFWTDDGQFRTKDDTGLDIDASDQGLVDEYPFPGIGMEAFATQAVRKERFIRTMINTHFNFYFGRSMRFRTDERRLYKTLWDHVHQDGFTIRGMIRKLMSQPEYLGG